MALDAKAKAKIQAGRPVVNFTVGEPDFEPPEAVRLAAAEAVMGGYSKYTPALGLPALRKAIADKFLRDQGLTYTPEQIGVSVGAKHALFNVFYALLNPGDEVIVPAPYWVTYPDQILLAGGVPVIIPTTPETGFKLTAASLEAAITKRTRALVWNSPCNPTGAVYSERELEAVMEVALRHHLTVIADEIYEMLTYGGAKHISPASLSQEAFENTIVVHGVSKTYAMTGWRIGFTASPSKPFMDKIAALQSQMTSNPTAVAQRAAEVALKLPSEAIAPMIDTFRRRREVVVEGFSQIPGIKLLPPEGAFYVFPDASSFIGKTFRGRTLSSVDDLADFLLEEADVAIVPGSSFGAPPYFRLSFATSEEAIREGVARMKEVLAP